MTTDLTGRGAEGQYRRDALRRLLASGQAVERTEGRVRRLWARESAPAVLAAGSIGPTAMERALLAHLGAGRRSPAAVDLVGLVAWCALTPPPSEPNALPWAHLGWLAALADELRTAG